MKLSRISVKKLFGLFDHDVDLRQSDGITIIYGPNGIGKTAILKLVNSFFTSEYSDLRSIPFSEFQMEFNDNSSITIEKRPKRSEKRKTPLLLTFHSARGEIEKYTSEEIDPDKVGVPVRFIDDHLSGVSRVGPNDWLVHQTGEVMTIEGIIRHFPESFPRQLLNRDNEPEWLRALSNHIDIRIVQAQRLVSFEAVGRRTREYDRGQAVTHAVRAYSEEITQAIRSKLEEYARLSQSLDRTFPARVLSRPAMDALTSDQLRLRLDELEKKRTGLRAAGLLEEEHDRNFQVLTGRKLDPTEIRVLSVYLDDVEQKLSVFNEIAARIDLLTQIINDHFKYKKISVSKDRGFLFTNDRSERLTPIQLSSGEQNELVILYELLFNARRRYGATAS